MAWSPRFDRSIYQQRRSDLVEQMAKRFVNASGILLLFADFDLHGPNAFLQESSFYYYTGIREAGVTLMLSLDGSSTLFTPNFGREREKWVAGALSPENSDAYEFGFSAIDYSGAPLSGYTSYPFFQAEHYQNIIHQIQEALSRGESIFTLCPQAPDYYFQQRWILQRLAQWIPQLPQSLVDISLLVAEQRRTKTMHEVTLMRRAIEITIEAHEQAAQKLANHALESDLEAAIEYTFIRHGARRAFPSIVAAGRNGTILHYVDNNAQMNEGDLVVVDIGARYGHYCADITRTYPVTGSFTARQRELYDSVLEAQNYIWRLARPGIWLSNRDYPERSLNHLAKKFIADRGYGDYFIHGIGHFLGLDVHDVGDYAHPLRAGDVITIEPGIYIPAEGIGIRIEDNYLITEAGAECLSAALPKSAEEIEAMVRKNKQKQ